MIDPPTVEDVLVLDADGIGPLTRPILLVGLTGWFDVAGVATTALEQLVPEDGAVTVGEIDPDPFYTIINVNGNVNAPVISPPGFPAPGDYVISVDGGGTAQFLVPEPATLGLIGVGLLGIGLIRRRRAAA